MGFSLNEYEGLYFFHEEWDIHSVTTSSTPYLAQMCY